MSGVIVAAAAASAASSASATAAAGSSVGFLAGIIGFAVGVMLSWPALVALALLGVLFERNGARGWAVFTALIIATVAYFFFAIPLMTIAIGSAAYIVIGLLWSVYRYKRHVDQTVSNSLNTNSTERAYVLRSLHPKAMLSTITAWILIWPFSFVENISRDLINAIELLVSKVFRGVYHKIYNSAVSALNIPQ